MEKIRINDLRLLMAAIPIVAIDIFLLNHIDNNSIEIFIGLTLALSLVLSVSFLVHKYSKSGLFLSHEGACWINGKKSISKEWSDIKIEKKINFPLFKLVYLNIENERRSFSILLCWVSEENLIYLTKKFVPRDHELWKVVKEYAERRGLALWV